MPTAVLVDCGSGRGWCLGVFLKYLAFEVALEGEGEVLAVTGDCGRCPREPPEPEGFRVLVADREAALSCPVLGLEGLARELGGPVGVRVDRERRALVFAWEQAHIAFRELERLLAWAGLIWYTPPLSRERVIRALQASGPRGTLGGGARGPRTRS